MKKLKVLLVDLPVVALSSPSTLFSEGELGPKDSLDKRIDSALRTFEHISYVLRASAANTIMSRAAVLWMDEVLQSEIKLPKRILSTVKKVSLAAASLDVLQFSARAMSSNVVARRNMWLRGWGGDSASVACLVSFPIKGDKLLGGTS